MAMTIVETARPITGGVDTHLDLHVAAALDANGGVLGVESFPATRAGYRDLHAWLDGWVGWCGSESRAPARMALGSVGSCVRRGWR